MDSQERKRLLRKARNRRYYEKQKREEGTQSSVKNSEHLPDSHRTSKAVELRPVVAAISSRGSLAKPEGEVMDAQRHLGKGPFSLPVGPTINGDFLARIQGLNRMLNAWGFRPPSDFKRDTTDAFEKLRRNDPEAVARFVHAHEDWLAHGDKILDEFDQVVAGDLFTQLSGEVLTTFWKELTSIAFQVMYAMSFTEARLDMMLVS